MLRRSLYTKQFASDSEMDRSLIAGVAVAALIIIVGAFWGGNGAYFFDFVGLIIVFGGTFAASLIQFSWSDLEYTWRSCAHILHERGSPAIDRIRMLSTLAQNVKRNGLITLDREAQKIRDPFLRLALELTVDGQTPDEVRRILETELRTSNQRHLRGVQVLETFGSYSPAMGLIGTLFGLVQMLGVLGDPAKVGPAMSVALLTTLYGAVLANLVFLPLAGKLRNFGEESSLIKAITIEGVISLGREESPIVLEQRLQGFLPLVVNR